MQRDLAALLLAFVVLAGCGTTSTRRDSSETAAGRKASAAEINVSLGQSYMRQGKLEIAKQKLERALALDPKLPDAHTVMAVLFEQINDPASAAKHYQRAAELAPKSGVVNNNYGTYLCKQGEYERADAYYAKALQDPFYDTPAVALANRGACALRWNKPQLAEDSFRRALQISPDQPDALLSLAEILYQRGDYFHARAFVQRHDAGGKAGPDALLLAMRIEHALGDRRAAREYKNRLVQQYPESDQAQNLENPEATR
jgi:type IV pilus assembly protein PilF